MITGQNISTIKTFLPVVKEFYDADIHDNYTLFAGSKIIQTRSDGNED